MELEVEMDLDVEPEEVENVAPRRSRRRSALAPIINQTGVGLNVEDARTPTLSQDEFIIKQRGRRRQPITWSPVEYNRADLLGGPRDRTPENVPARAEISSRLRRRLVMNHAEEAPVLGNVIAKKLKEMFVVKEDALKNEGK